MNEKRRNEEKITEEHSDKGRERKKMFLERSKPSTAVCLQLPSLLNRIWEGEEHVEPRRRGSRAETGGREGDHATADGNRASISFSVVHFWGRRTLGRLEVDAWPRRRNGKANEARSYRRNRSEGFEERGQKLEGLREQARRREGKRAAKEEETMRCADRKTRKEVEIQHLTLTSRTWCNANDSFA